MVAYINGIISTLSFYTTQRSHDLNSYRRFVHSLLLKYRRSSTIRLLSFPIIRLCVTRYSLFRPFS